MYIPTKTVVSKHLCPLTCVIFFSVVYDCLMSLSGYWVILSKLLHLLPGDNPADSVFDMAYYGSGGVNMVVFSALRPEHTSIDQHRVPSVAIRSSNIGIRVVTNSWRHKMEEVLELSRDPYRERFPSLQKLLSIP